MVKLEAGLYEQDEDTRESTPGGDNPIPVFMTVGDSAVTVEARDEHGNGFAVATVLVEMHKGSLRLLVWDGNTDNDSGDPSHTITILANARERVEADSVGFVEDDIADAEEDEDEDEDD